MCRRSSAASSWLVAPRGGAAYRCSLAPLKGAAEPYSWATPGQRARSQGDSGADQGAADGLGGAVGTRTDQWRGAGGRDGDEAREQRGALRADPLHAHVPAHEADDGDDRRLPQQRGGLRAVGAPEPRRAVQEQSGHRGLGCGDRADRGGQQPWPQGPQHRYGEHGEPHLAGQRARGEGEARAVRTAPALHGEGADRDEQRPVQHGTLGPPPVQQRDQDGHDHRRAAHEHARDGRFRGAFGGDDGEVEADHPHGREQREAGPLAGFERPQPGRRAPSDQREEQQRGHAVAQELSARVRVVAEKAVGGEGPADEDTGERGEQRPARGGDVHGSDVRKRGGPV